jgi:hypothetical protein
MEMLFGNSALESIVDYNAAGQAQAYRVTAAASGSLRVIKMYVDATNEAKSVIVGLYSDGATGRPATLLDVAAAVVPVAGSWNDIVLPPVPVASGSTYWIAVLGAGGTLRYRDRANAGISETSARSDLVALPASWSSGVTYSYASPSIWAAGLGG